MPRVKLRDDLKVAIKDLDHKEKDKLLLRLIPKDDLLVEQLTYKLLENASTQIDRREELKDLITDKGRYEVNNRYGFSPALLQWSVRHFSGRISRHVRVTKDKYGEIELNIKLIKTALKIAYPALKHVHNTKSIKLREYVVSKFQRLRKLSSGLHPDLLLDFEEDLQDIGECISEDDTFMRICIHAGLDVNHLLQGELPSFEI